VPSWSKDDKGGAKMINARIETLDTKPAFKEPLARQRCIVLADGFYEWKAVGGRKVPYFIHRRDGAPFAFAGLWDRWSRGGRQALRTCTVVTLPPAGLFATLHDRMPAILAPEQVDAWLSPAPGTPEGLKALLTAAPSDAWVATPVSNLVNAPANDSPECVAPVDPPEAAPAALQLDLWK